MKDGTIGNQQAIPSEAEIAWLAGLIEADGSLVLEVRTRKGREGSAPKIGLMVCIYNTDALLIKQCLHVLRGLNTRYHLSEDTKERLQARHDAEGGQKLQVNRNMLRLKVSRFTDTFILLKRLRPWLYGEKSARADIMLEYLEMRLEKMEAGATGKIPIGSEELNLAKKYFATTGAKTPKHIREVLNDCE